MRVRFSAPCAAVLAGLITALAPLAATAQVAQPYTWKNVRIVGGGFVTGIITHPNARGLMYARTDVGGAYRWDADRKVWIPITDWVSGPEWNFTGIESLALDPTDPDRVYLAAGTYTNEWAGNGAIFRSRDRGRSWQRTDLPFKNGGNEEGRSNGERLAVDPNEPSILLFGTRTAGLWKSADHGATWNNVESFPEVATSEAARFGDGQWSRMMGIVVVQFDAKSGAAGGPTPTIYAAVSTTQESIHRSTDAGRTWQAVPGQPLGLRPSHMEWDADGVTLYVTYGNAPGPNNVTDGAVWKLDTSSGRWTDVTPVKPNENDRFGYGGVGTDAQRPGTLVVSTICRWARGDDVFRSTDGGGTWVAMREKATIDWSEAPWLSWGRPQAGFGHWMGDIEIDPFDSDHVLFVTGTGIRATDNATAADKGRGTLWVSRAKGIEECVVNEVVSPPAGASLLSVMWDIDGFRHEDLDVSPAEGFFKPHHGRNTGIDFAELNPDVVVRVYGGNNTHGAYSLDNGRTWTAFAARPASAGDGSVAVSADGATFVVSPENAGALVSHDRGATWKACQGLPSRARVIADRVDANAFYALAGGRLLASTDRARSFAAGASGLPEGGGYMRAVPLHKGHLWLAAGEGLYRSTDGGATFALVSAALEGGRLGFGKAAPGRDYPVIYYVGHVNDVYGFFRSDDAGQTWVRINDDQHQFAHINSVTGDPRVYGRVYVGSASRGILYGEPKMGR